MEEYTFDMNTMPIVARSRSMKAEYTIEPPCDWPKMLRERAVLHRKAADELEDVADYLEEHKINPEHYDTSNNKKLE
jgi:hypothetical protein